MAISIPLPLPLPIISVVLKSIDSFIDNAPANSGIIKPLPLVLVVSPLPLKNTPAPSMDNTSGLYRLLVVRVYAWVQSATAFRRLISVTCSVAASTVSEKLSIRVPSLRDRL